MPRIVKPQARQEQSKARGRISWLPSSPNPCPRHFLRTAYFMQQEPKLLRIFALRYMYLLSQGLCLLWWKSWRKTVLDLVQVTWPWPGPITGTNDWRVFCAWAWGPLLERNGYSRDHGLRGVLRTRPPEFAVIPSLKTQNFEKWCELSEHPWLVSSGNGLQVQIPSSPLKTLLLLEQRFTTCGSRSLGLQSTYLHYTL